MAPDDTSSQELDPGEVESKSPDHLHDDDAGSDALWQPDPEDPFDGGLDPYDIDEDWS